MSRPKISILLLGGGRRVSFAQQLIESGAKIGYEVEVISYDLSCKVPISLIAKVVKGLPWDDKNIIRDIQEVIESFDINVILPIVNGAIEVASICKVRFPKVFVPVTDFEMTSSLFDKADAAKVFKEADLPIPRTYSILSARMPAIVKPRKGGSSRGIKIFYDMDDLMHLHNLPDYLIQEYIEHFKEYTVDCYVSGEGEILVTVPRQRLEIMGGESTRSITCHNEIMENLSKEVIGKFRLRGPVNIQFIHDLDADRFLLMEVNPRVGSGMVCSILAGAPITDYIINEALGHQLLPCNDWIEGALMARYFKEAIFFPKGEGGNEC